MRKTMKMRKKLRASSTVEVLYIMPIVFLVFQVCVYLGFYFHDKNVLQSLTYEALIISRSMYYMDGTVETQTVETFLKEGLEEGLFFLSIEDGEIEVTVDGKINIYIKAVKEVLDTPLQIEVEKGMTLAEGKIK